MKNGTKHRAAPLLVATAVLAGLILILGNGPVWANNNCSIGDFVFEDADRDGCQYDERPIAGVVVKLFKGDIDCGGLTYIASATTNADGFYEFYGLDCSKGYKVQFGDAGAIYTRTLPDRSCADNDDDSDKIDSDCSQEDGFSGCVTFPDAENNPNNPTIDCGYVCGGKIGDYVWLDDNQDGCQEPDAGIGGVEVTLFKGCGDGKESIGSTMTNDGGLYEFTGLCPGEYFVEFGNGRPNTDPGQSCGDNGDSEEKDSNCGDPGLQCVTLDSNNIVDNTIDCGKVNPCQLVVEKKAFPETIECIDTGTDGAGDDDCICPCVDSGTDTGTDGEPACIVERVTYTYIITNNGKVALADVTVFDDKLGTILVEFTELAPGASETVKVEDVCLCDDTINKVTVTGKLPNGELCTAMDSATVTTDLDCIDTGTDGI